MDEINKTAENEVSVEAQAAEANEVQEEKELEEEPLPGVSTEVTNEKAPVSEESSEEDDFSDEEDFWDQQGRTVSSRGYEVSKAGFIDYAATTEAQAAVAAAS